MPLRPTSTVCSYWGEALKWGPKNKLVSAEACCQACLDYKPGSEDDMDCNGGLGFSSLQLMHNSEALACMQEQEHEQTAGCIQRKAACTACAAESIHSLHEEEGDQLL